MKSYDDLQRFKEKTQTNHIEFKDMSEQTKNSDNTNWAIIKQLMTDDAEPTLGNGQRIDVAAPQPVGEDVFKAVHVQPEAVLQTQPHSLRPVAQQHSVAALVARPVGAQVGGSLLDSISASLKPAAEPAPAAAETLLAAAQPDAFAAPPARTPVQAELPRFKQLFSTAPEPSIVALSKDTLLQPLLERIASCR